MGITNFLNSTFNVKLKNKDKKIDDLEKKVNEQEAEILQLKAELKYKFQGCSNIVTYCNRKFMAELKEYNKKHTTGCAVVTIARETYGAISSYYGEYQDSDISLKIWSSLEYLTIELILKRSKFNTKIPEQYLPADFKESGTEQQLKIKNYKELIACLESMGYYFIIQYDGVY